MTDSKAANTKPGKRERLVAAAGSALYEQGVERTTIADIARSADVPVGNVYYYFKTKNDIIAATIDRYQATFRDLIGALDRRRTPKARLHGLVQGWVGNSESLTAHGCPVGTLTTELHKGANELAGESAELLTMILNWIEAQFRDMGRRDARELAVALLSAYEGVAVLAHALGDQGLIVTEGKRLERWIDSLA
jgi:AcrR family transcriptional regulator